MREIEALRISEKFNLYGCARAEALCLGDPLSDEDLDNWYVVVQPEVNYEWTDERVKELCERLAPTTAAIAIERQHGDEMWIVSTAIPRRPTEN